jgi:hypothetical protein
VARATNPSAVLDQDSFRHPGLFSDIAISAYRVCLDVAPMQWALPSLQSNIWEGDVRAILIAMAIVLAGCANKPDPAQLQAIAQARAAADDAKCQSYGAKPGEPAYIQCRVALDNQRAQMRATVAGALIASQPKPQPLPAPTMSTTNCQAIGNTVNCQTH